jgi:hypothetical protein
MKNQAGTKTCLFLPPDVRGALEAWATRNMTSLSAEIARSIRERAKREAGTEAEIAA